MLQVEVFDVEGEDLGRSGRRFIEHPPQRPLAQRDVATGQQPVDGGLGDRAGLIGALLAAFGLSRDRRGGPVLLGQAPEQPGGDGGAVAVPGRRRARAPQLAERGADLGVGDIGERPLAAEQCGDAVDGRGAGAAGVGVGRARGGEEGVDGRGEADASTTKGGDLRPGAQAGRRAAVAVPAWAMLIGCWRTERPSRHLGAAAAGLTIL
ncbi:hypothetical protein ACFXJ8_40485 [Nonomuraea sp. NPDC059194]|uniref:hypothetical protein n=1 Tax=Nonomuraea sp. NPDC059194 TaxID=3346764 RepID=UPI0036B088EC